MPTFSTQEVARLAALARIDLTPAELDRFAGELEVIAHAVEKVSEVATADVPATSHPIPLVNVWREDVVETHPGPRGGARPGAGRAGRALRRPADPRGGMR